MGKQSPILVRSKYQLQNDLFSNDLERLSRAGIAAVDTELTGLNPYRDLLCLVQICDPDGHLNLVKTENWENAKILKNFLENDKIIKVFHFALADCSTFLIKLGTEVKNVYCTKIASKIARTYTSEHDLRGLVKEFFNIELDKSHQSTDWLRPDLSGGQLEYAVNDVLWLIRIKEKLDELLRRKGNLPTGPSYTELNNNCQKFIPWVVNLYVNGWNLGFENRDSIFSH